jgi:hypothetical protein
LSGTVRNEISVRLRRLPREFVLALINATAILVMVAAILALLAIVRIDNLAGNVAARMTEAVLSRIELPSRDVLANLRSLREDVRTLGNTFREIKTGENPILQAEIARLTEAMAALNGSIERLANARTILTDEAIGQLGRSVTDTLTSMRGCAPRVGQARHHRGLVTTHTYQGHQLAGHESGRRRWRAAAVDVASEFIMTLPETDSIADHI